jgi:type IV pilus assembly protein PilX
MQGMSPRRLSRPQRQHGVALFIVIVFVMLSMLLAVSASRTSLFNEMVVGNDADYQRAFEAAQALLQDAELDIRGETASGQACGAPPCRAYSTALQFPTEAKEINALITALDSETTKCKDGLCTRRTGRQDFWNYTAKTDPAPSGLQAGEVTLEALTAKGVGARYGQFTGAQTGTSSTPANPILADQTPGRGGWYWIEILPYSDKVKTANLIVDTTNSQLPLNLDVYVVYRITALAYGRKEGSIAVLQETYARQRRKD